VTPLQLAVTVPPVATDEGLALRLAPLLEPLEEDEDEEEEEEELPV
jgi:hypothetical protein